MTSIWFDGHLVPLEDARVSVLAHTLHYGVGVFEGIRSYATGAGDGGTKGGASIFRLADHLRRLEDSARICHLRLPFERAELTRACIEVLEANDLLDGYLRPIAWQDDARLGGLGSNPPLHLAIAAQAWGAYLGEEGLKRGIRVRVSAYRRGSLGGFSARAKISGQYVTSTLAKREALALGYSEALLTDDAGHVCEGSGENLFLVRDAVLVTPPTHGSILPGITRETVLEIAQRLREDLGLRKIVEAPITRDALFTADEVFLTGTAAEVTPVREVDDHVVGAGVAGPVTLGLQAAYFALVRGSPDAIAVPETWFTRFGALVR